MQRRQSFFVYAVALSGLAMLRCGSADDSDALFAAGDAGDDGASSTGEGGSSTSRGSSGSSGTTGGSNDAGGTSSPGNAEAGGSGGITTDGGPGGTKSTLPCGGTVCSIPGQSCCVEWLGGPSASYQCVTGSTCPAPAGGGDPPTALQCSSGWNCPQGTLCCLSITGGVATSSCEATCTGLDKAQLCNPNAQAPDCRFDAGILSGCLSTNITDWGLPGSYATCGGRGR